MHKGVFPTYTFEPPPDSEKIYRLGGEKRAKRKKRAKSGKIRLK